MAGFRFFPSFGGEFGSHTLWCSQLQGNQSHGSCMPSMGFSPLSCLLRPRHFDWYPFLLGDSTCKHIFVFLVAVVTGPHCKCHHSLYTQHSPESSACPSAISSKFKEKQLRQRKWVFIFHAKINSQRPSWSKVWID